ncbi:hypothetical protein [Streptomyces sp. NBC_01233]|uniref:hypothetical protein n=1 Tax=Streptomyces sp. NBC_01233 TaxID=2903787 RepID=UPI002E0D55E3|nr:hypothetical protein OG332_05650 [Streptomyces sp. NBC_01233]
MTVHDLRHLAVTVTITAGVPLTVVSKTLRHPTLAAGDYWFNDESADGQDGPNSRLHT